MFNKDRNAMEGKKISGVDEDYLPQLQAERDSMDPSYQHASKLLDSEIDRVKGGRGPEDKKFIEVHTMSEVKVSVKVLIPNKAFPKYNFVGKLLGPGGTTMKKLQADTSCRMAVMGRGSMKDKKKEEELRKEGGKNAHLSEELHINIEAFAPAAQAYMRVSNALKEIIPFLTPQDENNQMPGGDMGGGMRGGYENGGQQERGLGSRGMGGAPPAPVERNPYREDPYYQEPAPPAPVSRGYDDYRGRDPYERPARQDYDRVPPLAGSRDPYERAAPVRGEYESRMPPASSDMRAPAGRGGAMPRPVGGAPPVGRAPASRDNYYDYPSAAAAPRERYSDPYDSRGSSAPASSGGSWGGAQSSYKSPGGPGGPARGRAAERPHPYPSGGRGAPRY